MAAALGIEIELGTPLLASGVGGNVRVWMHEVMLHLPGGAVKAIVGFEPKLPVNGLLGMSGFFEHFRVIFDGMAQTCEFERLTSQQS